MLPFFGGLAPALMLRINGNVNLSVDEEMMNKPNYSELKKSRK
jgi:hypothetical protein